MNGMESIISKSTNKQIYKYANKQIVRVVWEYEVSIHVSPSLWVEDAGVRRLRLGTDNA
jgi:hypothetical protein